MKAKIFKITKDDVIETTMDKLVTDDLFYMENQDGELISVSLDGDFILKATDEPINRDGNYSINCYFIGDLDEY